MAYHLIAERRRGGFGVVEEVRGDDGTHYAQKTLVVPPHLDPAQVKPRFEREVRYQSVINHNHVVAILEHDLSANPPWFIMHLAECSLFDEMEIDRTLGGNPGTALFHILAGLEEIHRLGYCHRDLKPHNVLKYKADDGSSVYAVSDFGLMAVGEEASSTLTPSGMGGGTPAYQAPECALNFKRATPRSDIYSFGAMLHDIFAPNPKRLPHEELTAPGDIGPIVEKCTKRQSFRRFKNVEELREALFNALNTYQFVYESNEEQKLVELLSNENFLPNSEQWGIIFDFLDTAAADGEATKNIFRALRRDHITQLGHEDLDLMAALGKMFADHCRLHTFGFEYCDVLASKAELFSIYGDVGLKADIAIAMLVLGVEHNRWFVERKFLQMVGPTAPDKVMQRMIVEMSVLKIDFKSLFERMKSSISTTKEALHPLLMELLS